MPYILVEDFRAGLDRRKSIITAPPGSLYRLVNGMVSRGGEIDKRRAFVKKFVLPPGTVGLASTAAAGLYVFGSGASPALPPGVNYMQLTAHGANVVKIDSWDVFAGKLYVAASFDNGKQYHFYNGVIVPAWDDGGANAAMRPVTNVLTFKNKLYCTAASMLVFCMIATPMDWAGTGSGLIDMTSQIGGAETLMSLAPYQTSLAIFARSVSQVWQIDDDPGQNLQKQVLNNIGTFASLAVTNFGDQDVFFLAESGVRSVKARDASNSAAVFDVGVPIDGYIHDILVNLTDAQRKAAISLIDQGDGRFWLILYDRIFVFSYYPTSKISAWSEYQPGFITDYATTVNNRIYLRTGNDIYLYGGDSNAEYDTSMLEVVLPYLDGSKPATSKTFHGIDAAAVGEWHIEAGTDPEQPETRDEIGILINSSFRLGKIAFNGEGTHMGLRLWNNKAERAQLHSIMVHFQAYEEQ